MTSQSERIYNHLRIFGTIEVVFCNRNYQFCQFLHKLLFLMFFSVMVKNNPATCVIVNQLRSFHFVHPSFRLKLACNFNQNE